MKYRSYKKVTFSGLLRGEFLIKNGSENNWKFMVYLFFLAFISITSSHIVDRKVMQINDLNIKLQDIKSQYTYYHSKLMKIQLESEILSRLKIYGLDNYLDRPYYIIDTIYAQNKK